MGCVAQAEGEEIVNRNNFVDYVVGPQNIQVSLQSSERKRV